MIRPSGIFLSVLLLCVTGCGYTTGSLLPSQYQTIYVAPFENKIDYMNQSERKLYVPGLETQVRGRITDRYLFDGRLHIGQKEVSDLVLTGQLLSFDREDLRTNANEDVKEYRLRITVAMTLEDPVTHKVIWSEPSFSGETTYYTMGPLQKSESAAIEDALKDLAMRVVDRTVQDW